MVSRAATAPGVGLPERLPQDSTGTRAGRDWCGPRASQARRGAFEPEQGLQL